MNKFKPLLLIFLIITLPISLAYQITYDANGNVEWTEKDNLFRQYDAINRLRYIRNGSTSSAPLLQEIIFHPIEERVWIKKNYNSSGEVFETFYYLSKKFIRKVNSSGSYDYTYIYLDDGSLVAQVNPDNSTLYFLTDNIGSNTIVTNSSGELVERNFFNPFGVPLDDNPSSDRLYENKEYDKITRTYDFNFRMFNGENGPYIFLQPDTLIQNVYNPQDLNRYMFENGNPYKYTDLDGHKDESGYLNIPQTIITAEKGFSLSFNYFSLSYHAAVNRQYKEAFEIVGTGLGKIVKTISNTMSVLAVGLSPESYTITLDASLIIPDYKRDIERINEYYDQELEEFKKRQEKVDEIIKKSKIKKDNPLDLNELIKKSPDNEEKEDKSTSSGGGGGPYCRGTCTYGPGIPSWEEVYGDNKNQ